MKLPHLAIDNHQFTLVFLLLLVGSGVTSLLTMPRSEDPPISPPGSSVIAIYPGASPKEIEQLVVDPLEEAINELDDIKRMTANIEDGLAVIGVEFLTGSDADDKHKLVVERVNRVRNTLPADLYALDIEQWSITNVAVLQIALIANEVDHAQLADLAEELEERLGRITGVKGTEVWACPDQQLHVVMNLERMAQLHIGISQLFAAIHSANTSIPGGSVDIGAKRLNVRTTGSFSAVEEIERTVVASRGGHLIRVDDVARVRYGYEPPSHMARVNGDRALFVTVEQKAYSNILQLDKKLKRTIRQFAAELPEGVRLEIVFDQSRSVASRIDDFSINLLMGVVLVTLIIFVALGLRAALIVALVIPTSVIIGLGWVDMAGFAIEQMSISGLVIALGLLVDNGIVVTESITRHLRKGVSATRAAKEGAREVAWPIISSTVTTVLAFLPMVFLFSITGDFLRSMPVTVIATLSASLLLALTLTPLFASRVLSPRTADRGGLLQPATDRLAHGPYPKLLDAGLRRPRTTLVLASVALVASVALAGRLQVSFFPKAEKPQLIVNIDLPRGSSLGATNAVARDIEALLAGKDEIEMIASNIGHGNPRIYYNVFPKHDNAAHSQILVQLKRYEADQIADLVNELRAAVADYPGVTFEIKELQQGPPVEAPIAIKVLGEHLDSLSDAARRVQDLIAGVPGVINVANPLDTAATDLRVAVNRDKVARLGFALSDIDSAVRAALAGLKVGVLRDASGDEIDIVMRATEETEPDHEALDKIVLVAPTGARIPLTQIAHVELERGPARIAHFNMERAATVTADVRDGYNVAETTAQVMSALRGQPWPRDIGFHVGGEQEEREDSFAGMQKALLIALLGILAVLVLQFRSFRQPLIVFAAVPLAAIGSIAALWLTGNSFSFTAFVGFTSLVGIVVNNSIILLDYANRMQREGLSVVDAARAAGRTRLLPILLTTATTIGGLLPLTLRGGTLWAPLGWTIIGGLTASTLLTLVVVPVLYSLLGRQGEPVTSDQYGSVAGVFSTEDKMG